jgi:hypothetical protein
MKIVNGTMSVISLMTDNRELISIKPGEVSGLFIATKQIIFAAMSSGPKEMIGFVINGSYESDLINQIPGAIQYAYYTEEEAVSKLIDKNKSYKPKRALASDSALLEIQKKDDEINSLKEELRASNVKLDELKTSCEKTINEKTAEVETAGIKYTQLELSTKSMVADIKAERDLNNKLKEDINKLKTELDQTKNFEVKDTLEYKELEDKYNKLKDEGQKLLDQTNQMKDDFNACCLKFGITRSKNGRWVMNGKSEESEESK